MAAAEHQPGTSSRAAHAGGEITIRGCTPQNPLIPANTNETCGGNFLDAITAKLVHYNPDTAAPEIDIAQSIETSDNQNFTVKLKPYKFQDGTEVKAKNFVDAWNWDRLRPERPAERLLLRADRGLRRPAVRHGPPTARPTARASRRRPRRCRGLKVVDDYTFTIKTTEKVSNLPVRLGYTAFAPLPDSFFNDPKAFGDKPIGAGPFKFDSVDRHRDGRLKFADYSGKFSRKVDKVTFKIYKDDERRLQRRRRQQPRLHRRHPADRLIGDKYKTDLPDRNGDQDVRHDRDELASPRSTTTSRTRSCARPSRWPSTAT